MKIYLAGRIAGDRKYRAKFRESRGAMVEWAYCQRIGKDCALYLDMTGGGRQ